MLGAAACRAGPRLRLAGLAPAWAAAVGAASCCSARQLAQKSALVMAAPASSAKQRSTAAASAPESGRPAARDRISGTSSRSTCSPGPSCGAGEAALPDGWVGGAESARQGGRRWETAGSGSARRHLTRLERGQSLCCLAGQLLEGPLHGSGGHGRPAGSLAVSGAVRGFHRVQRGLKRASMTRTLW